MRGSQRVVKETHESKESSGATLTKGKVPLTSCARQFGGSSGNSDDRGAEESLRERGDVDACARVHSCIHGPRRSHGLDGWTTRRWDRRRPLRLFCDLQGLIMWKWIDL